MEYDLEITDPTLSAETIAQHILEYIDNNAHPTAFKRMIHYNHNPTVLKPVNIN